MRSRVITVTAIIVLAAAPSFAQSARGFVTGAGGFAVSPDTTSGDWLGEAGVRVAPNLFVFGDLGQFRNLQPSEVQPAIDTTTAMVSGSGLTVVAGQLDPRCRRRRNRTARNGGRLRRAGNPEQGHVLTRRRNRNSRGASLGHRCPLSLLADLDRHAGARAGHDVRIRVSVLTLRSPVSGLRSFRVSVAV